MAISLLLVEGTGGGSFDLLQLLLGASGMVRGVLFLLVCLSIIGWYVIGYKAFYLSRAQGESIRFLEAFWQAKRLDAIYQDAEQKILNDVGWIVTYQSSYAFAVNPKLQNWKLNSLGALSTSDWANVYFTQ